METKNLEEMTKEELIELVGSLNRELQETKQRLDATDRWRQEETEVRNLLEKKITAAKAFVEVL